MDKSGRLLIIAAAAFAMLFLAGCTIPDLTEKGNLPKNLSVVQVPLPLPPTPLPPQQPHSPSTPSIVFLNVGMGESTLLVSSQGAILIDAGPDIDAVALRSALSYYGVSKLGLVAITRPTKEHYGGLRMIYSAFQVPRVITSGAQGDLDYNNLTLELAKNKVALEDVAQGWSENVSGFELTVLNPPANATIGANDARDSLVLLVKKDGVCALLMSDTQGAGGTPENPGTVFGGVESTIASMPSVKNCQILRVGDYASANTASFQLLDAMKPKYAIISVGQNSNDLPSQVAITRLQLRNISVFRTDIAGDVLVVAGQNNSFVVKGSNAG